MNLKISGVTKRFNKSFRLTITRWLNCLFGLNESSKKAKFPRSKFAALKDGFQIAFIRGAVADLSEYQLVTNFYKSFLFAKRNATSHFHACFAQLFLNLFQLGLLHLLNLRHVALEPTWMAVVLVHAADHLTVKIDERFFLPVVRKFSHESFQTPPFEFHRH